jgi:hypothetical protein
MMNPIRIRNEERIGSRRSGFRGRQTVTSVPGKVESVRRYEASGVRMAGMAERYWQELRPSDAGRFRLDATLRQDRDRTERPHAGRALRRPRRHSRPKLRTATR